ncbi:MAG: hypothetical protein AAFV19_09505 [Pseudomonadota bacterium]
MGSQSEVEKIALYLNLAYNKLRKDGGSLKFLTGDTSKTVAVSGGSENQETQVMSFKSAIWIANNDDGITTTMRDFCEAMEVKNAQQLIDHVEAYATRVLEYNTHTKTAAFRATAMPVHGNVLAALIGKEDCTLPSQIKACEAVDTTKLRVSNAASLSKHTLGGAAPKTSGVVFVHGTYDSTNTHTNMHAEQKLLAALATVEPETQGRIYVGGCKAPCSVCGGVLDKIKLKVPQLAYTNPQMAEARSDAGLSAYTASNIRELDVAKYFP